MTKWILLVLIPGILFQTACMQKNNALTALKENIQDSLAINKAHFGIAYKDLQTGETILLNEKDNFQLPAL